MNYPYLKFRGHIIHQFSNAEQFMNCPLDPEATDVNYSQLPTKTNDAQ